MFDKTMNIADYDPTLQAAIDAEIARQEDHIELIASENYASPRVMEAQGSLLTNKKALLWNALKNCLTPITPMSNRIPVRRPMRPCIWRC